MTVVAARVVVLPTVLHAQSALTGIARDNTGAVVPDVAGAPRARQIARDRSSGQYHLIGLRPGSYPLTFTLPGFSRVRLVLETEFTATVNAGRPPDRGIGHRDRRIPRGRLLTRGVVICRCDTDRKG